MVIPLCGPTAVCLSISLLELGDCFQFVAPVNKAAGAMDILAYFPLVHMPTHFSGHTPGSGIVRSYGEACI